MNKHLNYSRRELLSGKPLTCDSSAQTHIASFIVQVRPERLDVIQQTLTGREGVEIITEDRRGKLIVGTSRNRPTL